MTSDKIKGIKQRTPDKIYDWKEIVIKNILESIEACLSIGCTLEYSIKAAREETCATKSTFEEAVKRIKEPINENNT